MKNNFENNKNQAWDAVGYFNHANIDGDFDKCC